MSLLPEEEKLGRCYHCKRKNIKFDTISIKNFYVITASHEFYTFLKEKKLEMKYFQ